MDRNARSGQVVTNLQRAGLLMGGLDGIRVQAEHFHQDGRPAGEGLRPELSVSPRQLGHEVLLFLLPACNLAGESHELRVKAVFALLQAGTAVPTRLTARSSTEKHADIAAVTRRKFHVQKLRPERAAHVLKGRIAIAAGMLMVERIELPAIEHRPEVMILDHQYGAGSHQYL